MTKPKPKVEPPPDVPGDKEEETKMEEATGDQDQKPEEGSSVDTNDQPADKPVEDMDVD